MFDSHEILKRIWISSRRSWRRKVRLYWVFLLSAAAIAFLVYRFRRDGNEDSGLRGFLAFCFPRKIYAHPSALLDFKYFAVNTVVYGAFIAPLLLTSSAAALGTASLLFNLVGDPGAPLLPGGTWADIAVTVAAVVFADIGFFVSHYLQHKVGFLWEFHKVHHAAEVLHPLTLYRRHPVDAALDAVLMGSAAGALLGMTGYLFDESVGGVTILGTNAVVFLFHFTGAHLRHSHVRLSFGARFERIFISPTLHQFHHGCSPQHIDKNFGGIFSIWDRIAGTLYIPRDREELVLGLHDGEHRDYDSIASLYILPFVKIALRIRRFASGRALPANEPPSA